MAHRAVLYDEDTDNPPGQRYPGTVIWCLNRIRAADGSDDVEILGKVDIAGRPLKVNMSLRRNADASLPASHVMELKFDFNGGGISLVAGILMKLSEQSKGAPLAAKAVRVTDSMFMIELASGSQSRAANVAICDAA